MAGPGGQEIGRVSVRVLPDTAAFARSLGRYLQRAEKTLRVQIPTLLDDSGITAEARRLAALAEHAAAITLPATVDDAAAENQLRALGRRLSGRKVLLGVELDDNALKRIKSTGNAFTQISGATLKIAGLAATATDLAGLAVAAGQASGALLLLPAAGVAAGAVIATLAVGMRGFGEALSNLDDPQKFAQALTKLSPAARETALAVKDLQPAFSGLRLDVQERLFAGMGQTITRLGSAYLPVLRSGLGGIAEELNTGAKGFAAFLSSSQSLADTTTILGNVKKALAALSPAGTAFAAALRDIATVGSGFLPGLAASLATAAERFRAFIAAARESGQLQSWMAGGLNAFRQIWQILKNIGSIAASVFGALNSGGGSFLTVVEDLTGQLAAFFKTAEGREVLEALARVARKCGQVLSQVLGAALRHLGPAVVGLAPGFATFVEQLGTFLVAALRVVGPLLQGLAKFLSDNASWLGPVTIGLGALAVAAGPLSIALGGLSAAFHGVTTALNVMRLAMLANPFLAIAAAVTGLVVLIVENWDSISATTKSIFGGIWDFLRGVWDGIVGTVSGAVDGVFAAISWLGSLPGKVAGFFRGVYDGAVGALGDLVSWAGSLPGKILSALGNLGSLLLDAGRDVIRGLLDGMKAAAASVGSFLLGVVKGAVGSVLGFLGIRSPSRLMKGIGMQTARGFALGIQDGTPLAARAAARLADSATFTPARADFRAPHAGTGGGVTVHQTINAQPEQSPWSIATAANRQLGYAMRTAGTP